VLLQNSVYCYSCKVELLEQRKANPELEFEFRRATTHTTTDPTHTLRSVKHLSNTARWDRMGCASSRCLVGRSLVLAIWKYMVMADQSIDREMKWTSVAKYIATERSFNQSCVCIFLSYAANP